MAAHQGFSANLFTMTSDMFPRSAVGSVVGIGGAMGAFGIVLMQKTGRLHRGMDRQLLHPVHDLRFRLPGCAGRDSPVFTETGTGPTGLTRDLPMAYGRGTRHPAGVDRRLLLEAHALHPMDVSGGSRPGDTGSPVAGSGGARIPRRPLSAMGSLRVGGTHADRPGAARGSQPAQLDPVRHAAARRSYSDLHAALVLGADPLAGRGLRLGVVPRPGRRFRGLAAWRLGFRARRIHGAHGLAADPDELDLDSADPALLPAGGARPAPGGQLARSPAPRWEWLS